MHITVIDNALGKEASARYSEVEIGDLHVRYYNVILRVTLLWLPKSSYVAEIVFVCLSSFMSGPTHEHVSLLENDLTQIQFL